MYLAKASPSLSALSLPPPLSCDAAILCSVHLLCCCCYYCHYHTCHRRITLKRTTVTAASTIHSCCVTPSYHLTQEGRWIGLSERWWCGGSYWDPTAISIYILFLFQKWTFLENPATSAGNTSHDINLTWYLLCLFAH